MKFTFDADGLNHNYQVELTEGQSKAITCKTPADTFQVKCTFTRVLDGRAELKIERLYPGARSQYEYYTYRG